MHNYKVKYSGMYTCMPYFLTPIPKHRTESQDIIYHTPVEELLALHDDSFFHCSAKPFIIQFCLKNKRLLEV